MVASEGRPGKGAAAGDLRIGIDWGGTKIEAIALDPDGSTVARERIATPSSYEPAIMAVRDLVQGLEARIGRRGTVGLGIPGSPSPSTGLVRNGNTTWLNGRALDKDLQAALGRPVRLTNDANCLAVSEAVDGAGAGAKVVWAIILGTGVGSGIAIDGKPLDGREGIAGEWGHNPLPRMRDDERPGPRCWCGRDACIETFLSGPAMAADHERATGRKARATEIAAARSTDPESLATYERYVDRLGRALGYVINILDPDVIVFGGGASNMDGLLEAAHAATRPHVFSDRFETAFRKAMHGDSSGVRGAAWLWGRTG